MKKYTLVLGRLDWCPTYSEGHMVHQFTYTPKVWKRYDDRNEVYQQYADLIADSHTSYCEVYVKNDSGKKDVLLHYDQRQQLDKMMTYQEYLQSQFTDERLIRYKLILEDNIKQYKKVGVNDSTGHFDDCIKMESWWLDQVNEEIKRRGI